MGLFKVSSQLLQHNSRKYMIDCGEGTQMQMQRYKFSYKNLAHVFISHLHGDHYLGLMGMVSTFNLYNRKDDLHIYGPGDLQDVINLHLKVSDVRLNFKLIFHELTGSSLIFEDERLEISCFPMKHRIPTFGFLFKEKDRGERNLIKEFVDEFKPGLEQMYKIKQGADFVTPAGVVMKNSDITYHPKPHSYAYCCDTTYDVDLIPLIEGVDLLYHEATFDSKNEGIAAEKFHTTAAQAAMLASKAGGGKLLLGHFSARYKDRDILLDEARLIFENTELSREGLTYQIV